MLRAIKIRLYPNKEQATMFNKMNAILGGKLIESRTFIKIRRIRNDYNDTNVAVICCR